MIKLKNPNYWTLNSLIESCKKEKYKTLSDTEKAAIDHEIDIELSQMNIKIPEVLQFQREIKRVERVLKMIGV